jgi:hypothetical protein
MYSIRLELDVLPIRLYKIRNSMAWLEQNFFINNGLPEFFLKGKYAYKNKDLAINEYKESILKALNSANISFQQWSKLIIDTNYSVSY